MLNSKDKILELIENNNDNKIFNSFKKSNNFNFAYPFTKDMQKLVINVYPNNSINIINTKLNISDKESFDKITSDYKNSNVYIDRILFWNDSYGNCGIKLTLKEMKLSKVNNPINLNKKILLNVKINNNNSNLLEI
jgi:hypothetical protein